MPAADNRQIRVRAHEVVRELPDEVQQLLKAAAVYLHRRVLAVEADTVLVVIDVGRVLEEPGLARNRDGDNPVVLPRGVVYAPGVALVLGAELAARVVGRGQVSRRGYGLGVLLGLREVYRNVELAVLGVRFPLDVLGYAVAADVVRVLAEGVVPVRRGLGALPIQGVEALNDLRRARREAAMSSLSMRSR